MTFATTCIGLLPVMWSIGTGSDVMKRIAAPMVGGIFSSFALELLIYPMVYEFWKCNTSPEPFAHPTSIESKERLAEPTMALLGSQD
jgi:Cu(I)/Ag(I) efflux system membrane protein CusA/SilA